MDDRDDYPVADEPVSIDPNGSEAEPWQWLPPDEHGDYDWEC